MPEMKTDNIVAVRKNKTIYRDGDACVKVFGKGFSKADVLNEALNQARVEETGLNIPKIREVTMEDGKWAIVSDFIEGKTLAKIMEEDSETFDKHLQMFVDIQIKITTKTCPLLSRLKDKMHRKIDLTDLDEPTKYELHTRLEAMPKHTKLCHGDFDPSNIIITDGGIPYIIDWAHATQGNAAADAARTYLCFCLSGKKDVAEKYMNMYCKSSGTERKYVDKWLPIVAASQSVKGNSEEKELLRSWIDVFDYE